MVVINKDQRFIRNGIIMEWALLLRIMKSERGTMTRKVEKVTFPLGRFTIS